MSNNPFAVFQSESPKVAGAFNGLISSISSSGDLDEKTQQLIFLGIKASQGDTEAVAAHVGMAKHAGASREEVRGAILVTLTACGVTGVVHCLVPALETYDRQTEKENKP